MEIPRFDNTIIDEDSLVN